MWLIITVFWDNLISINIFLHIQIVIVFNFFYMESDTVQLVAEKQSRDII